MVEIAKTVVDTVIRKSSPTTKERGTKEMSEMQRNNKTAMITHFTTVLLITVLMLLQTIEGRSSVLYLIVMTDLFQ